jgi:6-phosphogluconolactonase
VPAGSGPRHAVFRPDGRYVYLVNELDSTVIAYAYDAVEGQLSPILHRSTLPTDYVGASSISALRVTPDGRFVYAANRSLNRIVMAASDPTTGLLEYLGYESTQGLTPRDFNIDPTGAFLFAANQDSDTIVGFHIDEQTGKLSATGQVVAVDTPVCVEFCPIN